MNRYGTLYVGYKHGFFLIQKGRSLSYYLHGGEGGAHHVVGGVVAVHGGAAHRGHRRLHAVTVIHHITQTVTIAYITCNCHINHFTIQ